MTTLENLTTEQRAGLEDLVTGLNEDLQSSVQNSTNHAFNVGCSVSLLPLGVLVIVVFFLSRFNWVVTLVAAVFSLLAALGLATLVSITARNNALAQTYRLRIVPEIERRLIALDLPRPEFDRLAGELLPTGALLRFSLKLPPPDEDSAGGQDPE